MIGLNFSVPVKRFTKAVLCLLVLAHLPSQSQSVGEPIKSPTVQSRSVSAPSATISGKINGSIWVRIRSGEVTAVLVDDTTGQNYVAKSTFSYSRSYQLTLEREGTYILKVTSYDLFPEYYKDAPKIDSAQRVQVKFGDQLTINFDITVRQQRTLGGCVKTKFEEKSLQASISILDAKGVLFDTAGSAISGNYEKKIPEQVPFFVRAQGSQSGYYPQYFDQVKDITYATPVTLDSNNKYSIHFFLEARWTYQNGIRGIVRNEAGSGVRAIVTAFLLTPDHRTIDPNFTTSEQSDIQGNFQLFNFPPGDYVLFARPIFYTEIPGYYVENGIATQSWQQATPITVSDSGFIDARLITMKTRNGIRGFTAMHGFITTRTSGLRGSRNESQSVHPISGAFIYLLDQNGQCSDYTFSLNNGEYKMEESGAGTLTVHVDRIGYAPTRGTVQLDYNQSVLVEKSMELTPIIATPVDHPRDAASAGDFLFNLFPNPSRGVVHATATRVDEPARMQVFNAFGQILFEFQPTIRDQNIAESLDLTSYPSGIYFLKFLGAGKILTRRMAILR